MVKHFLIRLWILIFSFCSLASCGENILDYIIHTDLDERLKAANTFAFLDDMDLNTDFGDEYSFIVIADTHIEHNNSNGLERLKDVTSNPENNIAFVVIAGDITHRGRPVELEMFIEISKSFGVPVYPIIGNHDVYLVNWSIWRDLIGSTRYRVNGGGTTLLILDSASSFLGNDQLVWLERQLETTVGNRVFVFSHNNLFIGRPIGIPLQADTRERARLLSILQGRCDIMFMGHSHENLVRETGGVKFLTIDCFRDSSIYCIVSVTKEGVTYRNEKL